MNTNIGFDLEIFNKAQFKVVGAFESKDKSSASLSWSDKNLAKMFKMVQGSENFTGASGSNFTFTAPDLSTVYIVGLGNKTKAKDEQLRKAIASTYKAIHKKKVKSICIDVASFNCVGSILNASAIVKEALDLAAYTFEKYMQEKTKTTFKSIDLFIADKKIKRSIDKTIEKVENVTSSVNFARDLVNEAPNKLHSEEYAKRVEKDVKTNLKGVKTKILGKADLKKQKMGCFLAVNAGSAYEPRLVHLTYTPKKVTKNTKHIALVGKGLTFDTGGYSLKPSKSMVGMKFDMGGSATVYGAFRAAVLNNSPYKITCILGITDNAVNEHATMPDSIVTARNGKTVEILNTDAEGRLVLADCLDYVSELKPDTIIDAATLTGACLVALGTQVCAVLGNHDKTIKELLSFAKKSDEYMWQLPIIPEWQNDMKSKIADLKNIGSTGYAGTATAACFLENFIGEGINWAHLDIAGVCDSQSHLSYCPTKGGSGLIVRTLHNYLMNGK
ncbi:MAG: leucyl aminopeptidase [Bacteriovoracaceae bacterium]|jgi:leucyl aminopeptidase|nr:leucyl aminopeptidase [Bacteriovoracaceae bacterium]